MVRRMRDVKMGHVPTPAAPRSVLLHHRPTAALAPFVRTMWFSDAPGRPTPDGGAARERALPTGTLHLAVRVDGPAVRLFDDLDDVEGRSFGWSVVGGVRSGPVVRDVSLPTRSFGVQFEPGGASVLLGVPARELSGRHTPLADLLGDEANRLHDELTRLAAWPALGFARLEALLRRRLGRARPLHAAVRAALAEFGARSDDPSIREVCRRTGYSERHVSGLFHDAVGLPPKAYCRVLRVRAVADRVAADRAAAGGWARLAADGGFSDQAHLCREFRALLGMPPSAYRPLAPDLPGHVPIR